MKDWILITEETIKDYCAPGQLEAFQEVLKNQNKEGLIARCIKTVTAQIYQELISAPFVPYLPSASKVQSHAPASLLEVACILILELLAAKLPGFDLQRAQLRLAIDARQKLRRIAKGEMLWHPSGRMIGIQHWRPEIGTPRLCCNNLKGL